MSVRGLMARLRLIGHRQHDWQFWSRVQDGERPALFGLPSAPIILIVERCARQPLCRAVRSYPFEPLIPDAWIKETAAVLGAVNPYRALVRKP